MPRLVEYTPEQFREWREASRSKRKPKARVKFHEPRSPADYSISMPATSSCVRPCLRLASRSCGGQVGEFLGRRLTPHRVSHSNHGFPDILGAACSVWSLLCPDRCSDRGCQGKANGRSIDCNLPRATLTGVRREAALCPRLSRSGGLYVRQATCRAPGPPDR